MNGGIVGLTEDCELYVWNSFGNKGNVTIKNTSFATNGINGATLVATDVNGILKINNLSYYKFIRGLCDLPGRIVFL